MARWYWCAVVLIAIVCGAKANGTVGDYFRHALAGLREYPSAGEEEQSQEGWLLNMPSRQLAGLKRQTAVIVGLAANPWTSEPAKQEESTLLRIRTWVTSTVGTLGRFWGLEEEEEEAGDKAFFLYSTRSRVASSLYGLAGALDPNPKKEESWLARYGAVEAAGLIHYIVATVYKAALLARTCGCEGLMLTTVLAGTPLARLASLCRRARYIYRWTLSFVQGFRQRVNPPEVQDSGSD